MDAMDNSNKIIFQVRFTNSLEEVLQIQNGLAQLVPNVDEFELDGVQCLEMNKMVNFFFLDEDKLYSLKSFLEYVGLRYISFTRNFKEVYDSFTVFSPQDIKFKKSIEDEILNYYTKDDILEKITERGINSLTPLDYYILNKN